MNIGIIGAGNLGTALARRLASKGHPVMLSFRRDADKLKHEAEASGARAGTPSEAAEFGEVIVLAAPWTSVPEALRQVGDISGNKVLWDCTNALKPDRSGLLIGTTTSGGEEVARLAPWANVVKAIPPFAEALHTPAVPGDGRPDVFICGDDAGARKFVAGLVEDIGASPVDAGPLKLARYAEPACMLLVQLAYGQGLGPRISLKLSRCGRATSSE